VGVCHLFNHVAGHGGSTGTGTGAQGGGNADKRLDAYFRRKFGSPLLFGQAMRMGERLKHSS